MGKKGPSSMGADRWPGRHYAYCRDRDCTGCLPSDAAMDQWSLMALWGEMLARCIAQTPETKTVAGALAALSEDGDRYREMSERFRRERVAADYWGPPPIPATSGKGSQCP